TPSRPIDHPRRARGSDLAGNAVAKTRRGGGRTGFQQHLPHPGWPWGDDASPDGAMLVMVREYDQAVYSIQIDRIESFQTREGVRFGSSEALVRASFGKPEAIQQSGVGDIPRAYCYLSGLASRLDPKGKVESLTVFPGSDVRKICKTQ